MKFITNSRILNKNDLITFYFLNSHFDIHDIESKFRHLSIEQIQKFVGKKTLITLYFKNLSGDFELFFKLFHNIFHLCNSSL